jgi:hypothetical protein
MFSAFARLPLGKWEKVPKGDEGSLGVKYFVSELRQPL